MAQRQHALFALNKVKKYRKKKSRRKKRQKLQKGGIIRPRYGMGGPYSMNGELVLY